MVPFGTLVPPLACATTLGKLCQLSKPPFSNGDGMLWS